MALRDVHRTLFGHTQDARPDEELEARARITLVGEIFECGICSPFKSALIADVSPGGDREGLVRVLPLWTAGYS
jgi:hypothetical protein